MRQEGLDPKGKVELARMLLQIGFKAEAITEYLMAAQMYEERGDKDQAINLYEKVVDLDKDNQVAKMALYKLKPRSAKDIDEMVAKMGLGPQPAARDTPPVTPETPVTHPVTPEEPVSEGPETAVEEPQVTVPTEAEGEQKTPSPQEQITAPVTSESAAKTQPLVDREPEKEKGIDLAGISLEESLASLVPLLRHTPDELKQRKKLASFFRDEGLWSEAFFEARPAYLHKPSVKRLEGLLSLLSQTGDKGALRSFLLTESFIDREPDLKMEVLKRLASVCEEQGLVEQAKKTREKLKALEEEVKPKKNASVKIIEDIPRLSDEETTPKGKKKKPPDPIQFM